jgi:Leucine-rich repeat (LRR) protein
MLSLKSCGLKYIPESISNLKSLEKLYLEDNLINVLPPGFENLVTLQLLDVSR